MIDSPVGPIFLGWFPSELQVYAPKPYPYLYPLEFIILQVESPSALPFLVPSETPPCVFPLRSVDERPIQIWRSAGVRYQTCCLTIVDSRPQLYMSWPPNPPRKSPN